MRFKLFIALIFACFSAVAQNTTYTGCLLNSDEAAYNSGQDVPFYYGGGANKTYTVNDNYKPTYPNFTSPITYVNNTLYNNYNKCRYYVSASNSGNCTVNGSLNSFGNKWTFVIRDTCTPQSLPIDDYIPVFIIFTAIIAVIFMRKSNHLKLNY